jgi:hypothetical protein
MLSPGILPRIEQGHLLPTRRVESMGSGLFVVIAQLTSQAKIVFGVCRRLWQRASHGPLAAAPAHTLGDSNSIHNDCRHAAGYVDARFSKVSHAGNGVRKPRLTASASASEANTSSHVCCVTPLKRLAVSITLSGKSSVTATVISSLHAFMHAPTCKAQLQVQHVTGSV